MSDMPTHTSTPRPQEKVSRCSICGQRRTLVLDHDHSNGMTRDWLCSPCNNGLGQFYDDPVTLRAAADYVERFRDAPSGITYPGVSPLSEEMGLRAFLRGGYQTVQQPVQVTSRGNVIGTFVPGLIMNEFSWSTADPMWLRSNHER